MQKAKSIALILGVLTMSFLVGYLAFAWVGPTAPPPGGNVPAPLNVGNVGQTKAGGLILNTGGASTGLIVRYGNVGIGTTGPAQKLDINGQIRIRGGNPAAGRVLTATGADGIATWQTPVSAGAPVGASYVVMALDGTLTAERKLTAGTGITISDAGANSNVTVGLSYPSKSCGSGYAIRSFNVGSSANPTCVAVGGQVPSYTVTTVTGYGYYNPSDVDWGAKAYAFCPSGYVRTGCSGYYPGICWGATACDFYGATPYGSNGCFAQARIRSGQWVRVDAYCLKIY